MSFGTDRPNLSARPYIVLAIGILAASCSSILIRSANAPSLIIGAWRLTLASLTLTPIALWAIAARTPSGRELRQLGRRDLSLAVLSGIFLGLHFATWITSLRYTTVASSVVLVSTTPLFVGLSSHFLLGHKLSRRSWLGILVSVAGAALISLGDFDVTGRGAWGDTLALLGAITGSAYFLIGRELRSRLSLLAYVFPTYWVAAIVLALSAWVAGNRFTGYAWQTWLVFLLLALGPQITGHSLVNWSLRHLSTTLVSVSLLGEPIFAAILAALILAEVPTPTKISGAALVLAGIYVTTQGENRQTGKANAR